jgi:hypothetical protein
MAATAPPTIRRRPGVLVAGAVVATARSRPPPPRPHPQPPRQLRLVSRCRPPPWGSAPWGATIPSWAATHHAAASRRLRRLHLPQGPPHPTRHRGQLDYGPRRHRQPRPGGGPVHGRGGGPVRLPVGAGAWLSDHRHPSAGGQRLRVGAGRGPGLRNRGRRHQRPQRDPAAGPGRPLQGKTADHRRLKRRGGGARRPWRRCGRRAPHSARRNWPHNRGTHGVARAAETPFSTAVRPRFTVRMGPPATGPPARRAERQCSIRRSGVGCLPGGRLVAGDP